MAAAENKKEATTDEKEKFVVHETKDRKVSHTDSAQNYSNAQPGNDSYDYYESWWEQEGFLEEGWRRISRWRELQIFEEEEAWKRKYSY